jgi:N-acylglucosamine-6-phosphate 2-epimerase
VVKLQNIGCDIVAVDGTNRMREQRTGPNFIKMIKEKYDCLIMADVSTLEEGIACSNSGADFVSTTLNGYTPTTLADNNGCPNFELIKKLVDNVGVPVVAEGRISTPEQAQFCIELGCEFVVVGSIITRPHLITKAFVEKLI